MVGIFGVAAAGKLRDPKSFEASLVALRLVPIRHAWPVAVAMLAAELSVAVLCLVPSPGTAIAGLLLAALLLTVFALVAASARVRRRAVPCRCFGRRGAPLGFRHTVRNGMLAATAVLGAVIEATHPPPTHLGGLLLTGLVAIVAVALVVTLDDVIDLFRPPEPRPARR